METSLRGKGVALLAIITIAWNPMLGQDSAGVGDLTELSIEDLMKVEVESVFGASKFLQKVTEAPASITIITAEEIRQSGHRTLADILRDVRGFYVSNDRNYTTVGVRGFARPGDYNTRLLLLIDGHRMNDNVFDEALLGTEFPLDVDLIERVEIVRGPSSSLYGTNALFGIINVITRQHPSEGFGAAGRIGTGDTYGVRTTYAGTGFPAYMVSASYSSSMGMQHLYFPEFDTPLLNNGIADNMDRDRAGSMFARLSWSDWTVQALYGSRTKTIPTASYGTLFNDPRTFTTDARGYLAADYNHAISPASDISAHVALDRYDYRGDYMYDGGEDGPGVPILNIDRASGTWWTTECSYSLRLPGGHTASAGMEVRDNLQQDQSNRDDVPPVLYADTHNRSTRWGLSLQDEMALTSDLLINAGIRIDRYHSFGATVNPRFGLVYVAYAQTSFKVLYGKAFRAPNAYELYYADSESQKPNPDLLPETIHTFELVAEHYAGDRARFSGSLFTSVMDNLISQDIDPGDGMVFFRNSDRITSRGVEAEADYRMPSGICLFASYAFQDTRDATRQQRLTNSPSHLVDARLTAPFAKRRLVVSLGVQYMSDRRTLAGTMLPGHALVHLTATAPEFFPGVTASCSLRNVFDAVYGDPGGEEHRQDAIPQDRRTGILSLMYSPGGR